MIQPTFTYRVQNNNNNNDATYFYVEYINEEITEKMCKFGDFAIMKWKRYQFSCHQ